MDYIHAHSAKRQRRFIHCSWTLFPAVCLYSCPDDRHLISSSTKHLGEHFHFRCIASTLTDFISQFLTCKPSSFKSLDTPFSLVNYHWDMTSPLKDRAWWHFQCGNTFHLKSQPIFCTYSMFFSHLINVFCCLRLFWPCCRKMMIVYCLVSFVIPTVVNWGCFCSSAGPA